MKTYIYIIASWPTMHDPPIIAAMPEDSMKESIEEVIAGFQEQAPGWLVTYTKHPTPEPYSAEAIREIYEDTMERHQHMATLYHWDAQALEATKPGGVVSATKPAPLSVEDIQYTLEQLAEHPNYKGQRVIVISEDHKIVTLTQGTVKVEQMQ